MLCKFFHLVILWSRFVSKNSWVFLAGMVCFSASTFTWANAASDAMDPAKERYCDPKDSGNAKQLAKIKELKEKLSALQPGDPKGMNLIKKMGIADTKLNCSYRSIQED